MKKVAGLAWTNAGTYTFTLPGEALYLIFVYKYNATSEYQLGVYLANASAANGGRVVLAPITAIGGGMTVALEIKDSAFVVTFDTNGQTYMHATVFRV